MVCVFVHMLHAVSVSVVCFSLCLNKHSTAHSSSILYREDGPDELYDDIGNIQASKPPMPPLPSSPPLLPSVPPPTFRPPPPMVVETPEINYEMDPNLQQNGVVHEEYVTFDTHL